MYKEILKMIKIFIFGYKNLDIDVIFLVLIMVDFE